MSKSKILFVLSGSVSAFKAVAVISRLVQDGHSVRVVMTEGALKFIGPSTIEGLTGEAPLQDLWEPGQAMQHIHLTRWADLAVVCPASANSIAKLALGIADDLFSTLALAWPPTKPFHVFPAMNQQMLANTALRENLQRLGARGLRVHDTNIGDLACGEHGAGRLLEPDMITQLLFTAPPTRGRVLVTAGATREPIDGIRFISNVSTGQTGAALADAFSDLGWSVTFVHGVGAAKPQRVARRLPFSTAVDLERKLKAELDQRDYRAVIHAAAVSDYSVVNASPNVKIPTAPEHLALELQTNPKILPRLKNFSRDRSIAVIGFKLTLGEDLTQTNAKARDLLSPTVDAIVANEWSEVERDRASHPGHLVSRDREVAFKSLPELARELNLFISPIPAEVLRDSVP